MWWCPCKAAAPSAWKPRWPRWCPRDGHVLVLDNGAYCKRAGKLTQMMGRRVTVVGFDEDAPVSPQVLDEQLQADASISHVILIHCETGTGVENPLARVAAVCQQHGKGLIVDAMSSFGALPIDAREVRFDALIAASGKCLEGVPGMGFVFIRQAVLDGCAGNSQSLAMDLHDQYSTWRRPASGASRHPRMWWWRWPRRSPSSRRKAGSLPGWRVMPTTAAR